MLLVLIGTLERMGAILTTAGPNTALVISGKGRDAKIHVGGRAVIFPGLMRCDKLSLELRTIQVESTGSMTAMGVALNVTGVCQVKVSGFKEENGELIRDMNAIRLAAQHFLGKSDAEIEDAMRQTMEGHQRAILGTLTVEEVYKDRMAFSERVREVAAADVRNMGMEIVSYTISSLTDGEGYLDALGVAQNAAVKRDAAIGRARGQAEAATMSAKYDLDATVKINDAKKLKAESDRDVKLVAAKIEEDTGKADEKAKAARILEEAVLQQEIVVMTERQRVREAEEHYNLAEVTANKEKMKIERNALAVGNAEVTRKTREADAVRIFAAAEAEKIVALGDAEAKATKKKYEVELEMLQGRAEAYKQFGNAAIAIEAIEVLPKVAESIASPLSKTEKMIFIGGGEGGAGASSFLADMSKGIGTVTETVNAMTGININRILQGYAGDLSGSNPPVAQKAAIKKQPSTTRQPSIQETA